MLVKYKENIIETTEEQRNALIEIIIKNTALDKDNYDLFGEIKMKINDRIVTISEEDLKEYFLRQV